MHGSPTDKVLDRAQTSPIGIVLILGITMAAAIAIVVLGTAALDDTQRDTEIGQAEQSLTQFDSRVSQVALGDSSSKTVGLGSGDYRVDSGAGSVTVKHVNASGNGNEEVIYEETALGSVSYTLGDTTIAYQGGGVWRQDTADGGAQMVSPPEFHYREATLTFPIILIRGESMRSGSTRAHVARNGSVRDIYPRAGDNYSDGSPFQNPVENGTVVVEIESQYCEGWRSYFISRTDGNVTACQDDRVEAQIISIGDQGPFDILDGNLEIRGAEPGNPEDEEEDEFQFEITFTEEGSDSNSGFSNFAWTMYGENVDDPDRQFEVYMESDGGSCGDYIELYVYHSNDGGETFQTWQNTTAFQIECSDDTESFTADFLGDVNMSYEAADPFMTDGGGQSIPKYNDGDRTSGDLNDNPLDDNHTDLENVTRHYMEVMGDMDLEFQERQQGQAGIGDASQGFIQYPGDGRVVTYLHITENEVEVELRSG